MDIFFYEPVVHIDQTCALTVGIGKALTWGTPDHNIDWSEFVFQFCVIDFANILIEACRFEIPLVCLACMWVELCCCNNIYPIGLPEA